MFKESKLKQFIAGFLISIFLNIVLVVIEIIDLLDSFKFIEFSLTIFLLLVYLKKRSSYTYDVREQVNNEFDKMIIEQRWISFGYIILLILIYIATKVSIIFFKIDIGLDLDQLPMLVFYICFMLILKYRLFDKYEKSV